MDNDWPGRDKCPHCKAMIPVKDDKIVRHFYSPTYGTSVECPGTGTPTKDNNDDSENPV